MPDARSKLLAYAQLMRLPNVFTAVADPLAGWFVVGGGDPAWQLALLTGASACLYTSGVVFNDVFDFDLDCVERPERPLPSGAISRRAGWTLATVLMITGLVLAALAGKFALGIGVFLAAMIFFYNAWARRIATLRPLVLGSCRFANFLLGMRYAPPQLWWMPAVLGAYAGTITFLSRHEADNPGLQRAIKWLLLGIIVVDAALVAARGDWIGAAIVLTLIIPAMALGKMFAMT
jgi:4-hydroxybenzoate polyprenyltransferase